MDAVIAGEGRYAEIRDDEPLRRQLTVVIAARPLHGRGHDIDARLQIAERLVDRKRCRDVLVQRGVGGKLTRPDLDAALAAEVRKLVLAERPLKIAVDHRVDEIAVADPKHTDRAPCRVDPDA